MIPLLFYCVALLIPAVVTTLTESSAHENSSTVIVTKYPFTTTVYTTKYDSVASSCTGSLMKGCSGPIIYSETGFLSSSGFPTSPTASQATHFPISSGVFKLPHANKTMTGSTYISSRTSGIITSYTSRPKNYSAIAATASRPTNLPISSGLILPSSNQSAIVPASSGAFLSTLVSNFNQTVTVALQSDQKPTSPLTVIRPHASGSLASEVSPTNHPGSSAGNLPSPNNNDEKKNESNYNTSPETSEAQIPNSPIMNSPLRNTIQNSTPTVSGQKTSTIGGITNKNKDTSNIISSSTTSSWSLTSSNKSSENYDNFKGDSGGSNKVIGAIVPASRAEETPHSPLTGHTEDPTAGAGRTQQSMAMMVTGIVLIILL